MHEFRVLKALDKIAAGKYGFTDDGQPIPKERLEVVPEADTLVDDHAKI
jgi:RNA polymerase-binding transcription factor DksA